MSTACGYPIRRLLCRKTAPSAASAAATPRGRTCRQIRASRPRGPIERERFAEALAILRPLAPDHPDQTDVRFLLGLAASRGSQTPGRGGDTARALVEAIAAFRSILIRQPGTGACAPGTGPGLLSEGGGRLGPRHFERALVGRPPACPVITINPGVVEHHAGAAPLARVFRVFPGPGYQYQRRIGRAVHLYRTACRSAGVRRAWPVPISAWWAGVVANTSFLWPPTGACVRGSISITGSTRGAGSTRRSPGSTRGRAG